MSPVKPLVHAVALALSGLACCAFADAESDSAALASTELDKITVSATRSERELDEVPVIVSIIERERIEETLSRNIKDLVRYEPGVSAGSSFGRFGLSDFRIRGLDGNRVRIEVDGIGVPDSFSIGSFASANRNFVDIDTLKRVEIVRGPGSSLYGSDALGGVVAFTTRDPLDYVSESGDTHLAFRAGIDNVDHSHFGAVTGAFASDRWSGLLTLNKGSGEQRRNQGDNDGEGGVRTRANPQDTHSESALAKLGRDIGVASSLMLTLEHTGSSAQTDVLSGRGVITGFGAPVQVLDLVGDDRQRRQRALISLDNRELDWALADSLQWRLAWQDAATTQDTVELRARLVDGQPGAATRRERRFQFDEQVLDAEVVAFKHINGASADHYLTWGFSAEHSDFEQLRDGRAFLPDGSVTPVIIPDTFPLRDFPLSSTLSLAAFVQDEIISGRWRVVPGLRVDHYRLSAREDPLFASRNPGIVPTDITETSIAPKLGGVVELSGNLSLFAGYARGFRAPPYNDVNLGFTNLQFGYTALPNPNLKPETSDGFEAGLRWQDESGFAVLSGFVNRYDDFIESLRSLGVDPESGLLLFQSQNVQSAEIRGAEFKAGMALSRFNPALDGWQLRAAAAWQRGRNRTDREPLASVDPLSGTLGLAWDTERFGAELATRFARRKHRLPESADGSPAFAPPGYAVADLLLRYDPSSAVRLNVGLFNLGDKRYFDWADVPLLAADSALIDRFTSPGRSVAATLRIQW